VKLIKFEFRGSVAFADTTNVLRLIIFRWNQDDSSAAPSSVGDIFQSVSPYSPYNRDNERAHKFDIVVDHLFGVANVGPGIENLVLIKQMKSAIAFQATATTGTGHLYYAVLSDSSGVPHVGLQFITRVYYTDS